MSPDTQVGVGGRVLSSTPRVVRTEQELIEAIEHVSTFDHFCIDVETDFNPPKINEVVWVGLSVPDRVVLIPMGHPLGPICVPAHKEKRVPPVGERRILKSGKESLAKKEYRVEATYYPPGPQLTPDVVFHHLEPLLFSDRVKIGHNLKFDLQSVAKYYEGRIPPGPYRDTLVLTHVLDENLVSYSLKPLVMDWLHISKNPDVRKKFYPNLGRLGVLEQPLDEVAKYLAKDVWYTLMFYRDNWRLLCKEPELLAAFDLEMKLYPVLMDMELTGVRIDWQLLAERGAVLKAEVQEITERIWDICGEEFDLTLPSKKRHYLFGKKSEGGQGLKPLNFTAKTNQPQLNQEVLEHYADTNELAALLLQYSEKEKVISTFITGLSSKLIEGRLHTSFKQHGTVTSRLSSSQPNLQQIPRGTMIRDAFIPSPGNVLLVADYDQIELRCAAYLSQDPEMMRVFVEGLDIHAEAAAAMLDLDLADLTSEQRQIGKIQNFGTLYGAGPDKIAVVADCSKEMAEQFISRYYEKYAVLTKWKNDIVVQAKNRGDRNDPRCIPYATIPPYNRRRRLPDLYSDQYGLRARAERQVVNSVVQGFAAYVLKHALIDLHAVLPSVGAKLILNVHDEIIAECPTETADEGMGLLTSTMENVPYNGLPILGQVPLTVKGSIATRWSEGK